MFSRAFSLKMRGSKKLFHSYPEILFVDAIFKVSNLIIPPYIFAVEGRNCKTEVVFFPLVVSEDINTIRKIVNILKSNNPKWVKTETVMIDKRL